MSASTPPPNDRPASRRTLFRAVAAAAVTAGAVSTTAPAAAAAKAKKPAPKPKKPALKVARKVNPKVATKKQIVRKPLQRPTPRSPATPAPTVAALATPMAPDLHGITTTAEWVMARRVALGSSYAVADQIKKVGIAAWLTAQFNPSAIPDPFVTATKVKYPGVWMTDDELRAYLPGFSGVPISHVSDQLRHVHLLRPALTTRHLQTAMADFWLDFFSLPFTENKVYGQARALDLMARELAFKPFPHIFARFIFSAGMYSYLDQRWATKAKPGENLAREAMELFSVGTGNFTEADVKAAARLLAGSGSAVNTDGTVRIHVAENDHEFGVPLTIRGKTYKNTAMVRWESTASADILQFARDLATDPKTVRRICTRIAQRFVSDAPPAAMVEAMVTAWNASGGNIEKVLRAMFAHPTWLTTAGHKWRRPGELWASMAATADLRWTHTPAKDDFYSPPIPTTMAAVHAAGEPVRNWPSPKGLPDESTHWMGTASVLGGVNFADRVLTGTDPHLTVTGQWAQRLGITASMTYETAAVRIIERVTGYLVPAGHPITATVMARLNGGTAPTAPTATLRDLTGVEAAVRAAFNSPLMFLR